jgi:hypothetical protein
MKINTLKKLALGLFLASATTASFAQGQVNFVTYNATVTSRGNIYLPPSLGGLGVGAGYVAQLWVYSASSLASMIPVTSTFGLTVNGAAANPGGTVNAGVQNIPLTLDPAYDPIGNNVSAYDAGNRAYFIIRVWNSAAGATWATATNSPNLTAYGTSSIFNAILGGTDIAGDPPGAPPTLNGFANFTLTAVPEPGTMALAALGGASLLLFRRRK